MIPLDKIVIRCDGLFWRNYDGELLIVRGDTSEIYMLNKVASHIWEVVDGKATIEDIIISICDHFEVERQVAERDVNEFINELINKNLLKTA